MIQDIRYAFRSLRKSPGFSLATVLTLALGIGANSAIFSVVNAVLIKPLRYKDPQQLMMVYTTAPGGIRNFVSQPDLEDWRASSRSFEGFASVVPQSVNVTGGDQPDRVVGSFVSANYFDVFGVAPALGRTFAAGEDRAGASLAAVLTDRIWRTNFGGEPDIVGRKLVFNGEPYTVVGVLRPDFVDQPWSADVYLPAFKYPNYAPDRTSQIGAVVGRLNADVPVVRAQAEMTTIAARLAAAYPDSNRDRGTLVVPLKEIVVQDLRPTVIALAGAVAFVLLIACANVAGLFASRMLARERERAVRLALGASRTQLISHILAEALVLAGAGGAVGLLLAMWSVEALSKRIADYLPSGTRVALDFTVLGFTAAAALFAALLIAAIPSWQTSGGPALREGRGAASGAAGNRSRSFLVAGEIALAMVLLIGAGLTIKSLMELGRAHTGFDPHGLLTFEYRVPRAKYTTGAAQNEFHRQVIESIRAVPGVIEATSVRAVPLGGNGQTVEFFLTDRLEPQAADRPRGLFNAADPDFFGTMRIPLLRGRVFSERDSANSATVIVINQTLAARYFAARDPVGQRIRIPSVNLTAEIVGIVGDVKQFTQEDTPTPQIYGALAQNPFSFTSVAVRTTGDPAAVMNDIRRAVWQVDKDQPMWKMRTMDATLAMRAQPREFVTSLLGGYASLALLLASIGIFGVVSYSVRQRTAEIGVRMALGARPGDVARMILNQGVAVTLIGIVVGAGAAVWLARLIRSQLYAVSPLDPSVYAMVAGLLAIVALAACLIPARRAMRVDPVEALRHD
ncbi:MAG TPA: ABC transporter permease [Bryobacteraceae bacterium]|nr:ABC transporter permease [Bryobacteraceae bacterium]